MNGRIKENVSLRHWILVLGEILALALIAIMTSRYFATSDSVSIVLAFAVAYLIPRFIYSKSKIACNAGQWLLLVVATLLAAYTILSIKACTIDVGCPLDAPSLRSDDGGYYRWALAHYDSRCPEPKISFKGLPLFMLWLWKLLGVSIVWPLALNFMFTLTAIVFTGKTAARVLEHKMSNINTPLIAVCAMLMISLMGFFMSQGVRIQKEAACSLGITLVGYALAGMLSSGTISKREQYHDFAIFIVGCIVVALVRTSFAYFAMIGAAMMAFANHRAHWKQATIMCLFAVAITIIFSLIFSYTFGQQYRTVDGEDAMAKAFKIGLIQQPYITIIGDYYHYPEWIRILLLPVTGGVQYVIPFPWLYEGSVIDIFSVLPRIRLMWYIVGGICIYYYLFIAIVHHKQSNLGLWALWPLATFFIIAFITGGSVSRYILPLQPLFVVIAVYVLLQVKKGNYRRSFTIWMIVYTFIMIALLIICYHTQVAYLNGLDEYYRLKAKHLI